MAKIVKVATTETSASFLPIHTSPFTPPFTPQVATTETSASFYTGKRAVGSEDDVLHLRQV